MMSERTLVRLAWTTWATSIALVAAGVGMRLTMRYGFPNLPSGSYSGETTIIPAVYATLGLVVATRRPRHPVGWLLMGLWPGRLDPGHGHPVCQPGRSR
jgi:hypothetical protein